MDSNLKRLIEIGGAALEAEDRFFLGSVAANPAYRGEKGGTLRIKNERYYQFVVARALASSFPYLAEVEKVDKHDLVLWRPGDRSAPFAVVEMKRWMGVGDEAGIPAITENIKKLSGARAEHALMLIFSVNPVGTTRRTGDDSGWEHYPFQTLNRDGDEVEFWVAGHELTTEELASARSSPETTGAATTPGV